MEENHGMGILRVSGIRFRLASAKQTLGSLQNSGQRNRSAMYGPLKSADGKLQRHSGGKAWCTHLESYSDYSNRLPRGRTYARNGSVVDLQVSPGQIEAIVAGSDTYEINIQISKLKSKRWHQIRDDCSASIDSLLDLLAGRFSDGVMQRLTDRKKGLFPAPREISLDCDCPDGARLCKHLAAVLLWYRCPSGQESGAAVSAARRRSYGTGKRSHL